MSTIKGRLPAGRRDRRPALAALALLLVLVGALGSALVAFRSGSRVDVLVAREEIHIGDQMSADDFRTIRVAADPSVVINADDLPNFVNSYAKSSIPAGAILNSSMFVPDPALPAGAQQVGVVVSLNKRITERPVTGDVVRLYYISSGQSGSTNGFTPGDEIVKAARVTRVGSGGGSDMISLTVLVPDAVAGQLANLAANGSVAITMLPKDTKPDVDETRG